MGGPTRGRKSGEPGFIPGLEPPKIQGGIIMSLELYEASIEHFIQQCRQDFGTYALRLKWVILSKGGTY